MMMVKTELRLSRIHGLGAFLLEPLIKGQLVWRFDSRIDRVVSNEELTTMPRELAQFFYTYSTFDAGRGLWVLCGDNGRHFNHSDVPNTVSMGIAFGDDMAAGDLEAGTELTSDYRTICDSIRIHGTDYIQPHSARRSSSLTDLSEISSR